MITAAELRTALRAAAAERGARAARLLDVLETVKSRTALVRTAARLAETLIGEGQAEDALAMLRPALAAEPDDAGLCWQAYRALEARNRFAEAVPYARRYYTLTGQGLWQLLVVLAHTAAYAEIEALAPAIRASPRPGPGQADALQHLALARLSQRFDRPAVAAGVRAIETSPAWLDARGVLGAIRAAQAARAPFSLVRLGDGEARFFTYLDEDAAAFLEPAELTAVIDSIWVNWFGAPMATFAPEQVQRLADMLADTVENATVLGVPEAAHVLGDHYHFAYQAVMLKYLLPPRPGQRFTSAFVHLSLHRHAPFLAPLIEGAPFLGFVGCHAGLAPRLAARFGVARHAEYIVPGEIGQPALPAALRTGRHFPEAFDRVLETLVVPMPGALFLVAAGLLGKLYCERIRVAGGIAIDIGAVADGWMGYNTRPGNLGDIEDWRFDAGKC